MKKYLLHPLLPAETIKSRNRWEANLGMGGIENRAGSHEQNCPAACKRPSPARGRVTLTARRVRRRTRDGARTRDEIHHRVMAPTRPKPTRHGPPPKNDRVQRTAARLQGRHRGESHAEYDGNNHVFSVSDLGWNNQPIRAFYRIVGYTL